MIWGPRDAMIRAIRSLELELEETVPLEPMTEAVLEPELEPKLGDTEFLETTAEAIEPELEPKLEPELDPKLEPELDPMLEPELWLVLTPEPEFDPKVEPELDFLAMVVPAPASSSPARGPVQAG